jgi:hypothetical protein
VTPSTPYQLSVVYMSAEAGKAEAQLGERDQGRGEKSGANIRQEKRQIKRDQRNGCKKRKQNRERIIKRASEVALGRGWGRPKLRQAKRPNHAKFELAASKCQPEACNSIKPIHTTTLSLSFHSVVSGLSS